VLPFFENDQNKTIEGSKLFNRVKYFLFGLEFFEQLFELFFAILKQSKPLLG